MVLQVASMAFWAFGRSFHMRARSRVSSLSERSGRSCCSFGRLSSEKMNIAEIGLLGPLAPPLLKPIFSSDRTRCCSSSDKLYKSNRQRTEASFHRWLHITIRSVLGTSFMLDISSAQNIE
ncbi:hypothetical protein EYF80_029022 [Liparis tanakae]|uniref:Uncharacterized protein n=1 Tax=Liparis tanakae TaxID=230148 RepID=A0A4Z2H4J5_9TELE|nr:hypothetical protein EYF80_029022 [Liparis tanakae]